MPWLQMVNPSSSIDLDQFQEALKPIEREISEIEQQSFHGKCCLCGETRELTEEHTPSKKAHNWLSGTIYRVDDNVKHLDWIKWKGESFQGGFRAKTLCEKCNNETGAWYNPEYLKFVRVCQRYANVDAAGTEIQISVNLRPARTIKQNGESSKLARSILYYIPTGWVGRNIFVSMGYPIRYWAVTIRKSLE